MLAQHAEVEQNHSGRVETSTKHERFHSASRSNSLICERYCLIRRAVPCLGLSGFGKLRATLQHGPARPEPCLVMLSAVMASSTMKLFEETGAYLRGHFRLTSGLHSGEYLQCAKVLAVPAYAERLGRDLSNRLQAFIGDAPIDVVVAPAIGGIIIGYEVARDLNVRSFFTERDAVSNEMTLRRGFEVNPDERALVIEDVVTTGGSTREVIRLLERSGATVLAAGSIIDRSDGQVDLGVPRVALEVLNAVTYDPGDCPLCKAGIPLVKPGSRRV